MRKIYYLSSCNTCSRIIEELQLKEAAFQFQDIKTEPISAEELDEIRATVDSYESLFNKRARKYRSEGLKDRNLSDRDWRTLILKEYTFLKRPIIQINDTYFIGNSKKTVEAVKTKLNDAK